MPDYQEMYLKLFRATEQARRILAGAQQECEELYISAPSPQLVQLPRPEEKNE